MNTSLGVVYELYFVLTLTSVGKIWKLKLRKQVSADVTEVTRSGTKVSVTNKGKLILQENPILLVDRSRFSASSRIRQLLQSFDYSNANSLRISNSDVYNKGTSNVLSTRTSAVIPPTIYFDIKE